MNAVYNRSYFIIIIIIIMNLVPKLIWHRNLTWSNMNLVLEYLDIFLAEMLKDKLWDVFPDAIGSVI